MREAVVPVLLCVEGAEGLRHWLARVEDVRWPLLDEEKPVLVRRLPPPPLLMLTRGRLDGMTARDRGGGGGGGTRDGYEYTLQERTHRKGS